MASFLLPDEFEKLWAFRKASKLRNSEWCTPPGYRRVAKDEWDGVSECPSGWKGTWVVAASLRGKTAPVGVPRAKECQCVKFQPNVWDLKQDVVRPALFAEEGDARSFMEMTERAFPPKSLSVMKAEDFCKTVSDVFAEWENMAKFVGRPPATGWRRAVVGEWDGVRECPESWKGLWTLVFPNGIHGCGCAVPYHGVDNEYLHFLTTSPDLVRPALFGSEQAASDYLRCAKENKPECSYDGVRACGIEEYVGLASAEIKAHREKAAARDAARRALQAAPQAVPVRSRAAKCERPGGALDTMSSGLAASIARCAAAKMSRVAPERPREWWGLRDSATGRWVRFARTITSASLAGEDPTSATAFPSRDRAASAMCAVEHLQWRSDLAAFRLRVERMPEDAESRIQEASRR